MNAPVSPPSPAQSDQASDDVVPYVGRSMPRVEDLSLLRGRGRFADDLPVPPGLGHVAFLRSPVAHARIIAIDTGRARALPGVYAVLSGEQVKAHSRPFITAVKVDAPQYALATERVRYVGEPVALVVAEDRYVAEDALDLIELRLEAIEVVTDATAAIDPATVRLHDGTDSNVLHERRFSYGEPQAAFARAQHVIETTVLYPRNSCTPIECFCIQAQHDPGSNVFDVTANFQGPYTLHAVMARALGVAGNQLRLRTPPDSGGSYGVKQALFPYVVALGVAAKLAGRPVKWLEDRLEHLCAATSATSRTTTVRAALDADGVVQALDYDQLEDCGAYLRAPEPATIYRMHGNMTGAYAVEHLAIRNRVVVTNRTPTGLMRGFGGPQVYFALERVMDIAAGQLGLDPVELRRRNLVPASAMPYRSAPGGLLDSGDYAASMQRALDEGGMHELLQRRDAARAAGRLYGIGCAAVVEPSISNMGYITTLLSPAQRERSGAKNGALSTATLSFDPSGALTANVASVPQGQGHRTVIAQVVADVLGMLPGDIIVTSDHDTARDAWSIASGNYASRFAGAVAGAAHLAALKLRERLARVAAADLNVLPEEVEFVAGKVRARANPDNALPLARVAAKPHWSPLSVEPEEGSEQVGAGMRETVTWSMPQLTEPDEMDRVNSSGSYGFIFDFCGVEIDPLDHAVRIDKYVTMHDAGRLLNPMLADGQVRGGFAHGLGAALLEELAYARDGSFQSGTFADYLPPTACEVPDITILHDHSPSPFTPLGAKGLGEGNCMSTPVCIANAVADATGKHIATLPLTRSRVAQLLLGEEPPDPGPAAARVGEQAQAGDTLHGHGSVVVPGTPQDNWHVLLDESVLAQAIPGCHALDRSAANHYRAELTLGVGPVKGRFHAEVELHDLEPPRALRMRGQADGPLGSSKFRATVRLQPEEENTRIEYDYAMAVSGKIAAVGARMIEGASRALVGQFFKRLVSLSAPAPSATSTSPAHRSLLDRLLRRP